MSCTICFPWFLASHPPCSIFCSCRGYAFLHVLVPAGSSAQAQCCVLCLPCGNVPPGVACSLDQPPSWCLPSPQTTAVSLLGGVPCSLDLEYSCARLIPLLASHPEEAQFFWGGCMADKAFVLSSHLMDGLAESGA